MRRLGLGPIGWHVFARGTRRLQLFHDDADYLQFLTFLRHALAKSGSILWAFALMSNHYHLVLYGSSEQLTACMRRLNGLYATYYNRRYGFNGHAFDAPYQAYPQPSPLLLLRSVAYVFMNPVDAGLARSPEQYRWSGYKSYTNLEGSPMPIDPSGLMAEVHADPNVAWKLFHRAMEREAHKPKRRNPAKLTMAQVHAQQFEWLLECATERAGDFGGTDPELVAMYWASCYGISPKGIGQVLGLNPITVSRRTYKFKKRIESSSDLARLFAPP